MVKVDTNTVLKPSFEIESQYPGIVTGIDEAGRGPLAGPVIASCVLLDRSKYPQKINDSKKLTEKTRENIFEELLELEDKNLFKFGVGIVNPETIDKINIRNATKLAMKTAYESLVDKYNFNVDTVLVDGNFVPEINTRAEYIIKGDAKSLSIAAASIIAKVTRDRMMLDLAEKYPEYYWQNNKGYGTKQHIEAINKYGITEHHRKSFIHIQQSLF